MASEAPICIDLCCGLGGWTEGFLAEGYDCIGYDVEEHDYGTGGYPGKLVLRDITTIHGSEFKDATCFVASPPCQRYSYMAMPWSRAKAQATAIRADQTGEELRKLNLLFDTCFRLQREAIEAAGHHIPMIVENVRGAQRWVGRAPYHYGSFYLWGDVPALMPMTFKSTKIPNQGLEQRHPQGISPQWRAKKYGDAVKVGGIDFSKGPAVGFNVTAAQRYREGVKADGSGWTEKGSLASHNRLVANTGVKQSGISGPRKNGKGDRWFQDGAARHGSRSNSRKAASAMIAKIPLPLSSHIARCFKPEAV